MILENTEKPLTKPHIARKYRRSDLEAIADWVHLHSSLLTETEKGLVLLVIENNSSFAAIARTMGVEASTVCRRYYRIVHKLHRIIKSQQTAIDQIIGREYIVNGLSQSQIATKLNISRYRVRKALIKEGVCK